MPARPGGTHRGIDTDAAPSDVTSACTDVVPDARLPAGADGRMAPEGAGSGDEFASSGSLELPRLTSSPGPEVVDTTAPGPQLSRLNEYSASPAHAAFRLRASRLSTFSEVL